jgi:4-amino-4-deoxy-L-arabinose transferase-like glycosyltransferase
MLTRWLTRGFVPLPRPRWPHPAPLALLLLCGSLFLQGINSRDLWASHEARAAQDAQRMLDDGNWLLPRLYDGQVELQKPPGFYWLVAMAGWMRGGVDSWAVRLPAVLAGMLTVLMVWWHLHRRGRPIAGFVAAAMLAGAVHFTGTARIGRIDVPLACAVTAIMLFGRDAGAEREATRFTPASRLNGFLAAGIVAGIALLLKGPIGVVLPGAALAAYCLVERIPLRPLILPTVIAGLTALAISVPWYLWANHETDGEFFRVFFVYHHLNRAFGGADTLPGHPWWFYLPRFAADFLPWTPLVILALIGRRWRGDADARFGLIWLAVMLAVLSCSRFKRADYLLPAYAGAAIFVGCAAEQWYLSRTATTRRQAACGFALVLAILPAWWLGFDRVVTAKEEVAHAQAPFARLIRDVAPAPEPIVLFRVESHLLAYHLDRPIHTLVEWTDLDATLRAAGRHIVVVRAEDVDEVREHVAGPIEVVARGDDVNGARSHRPLVLLRTGTNPWPTNPPTD